MRKNKLIILEGPDKVGKDTILKNFSNKKIYKYIQNNNPPDYRNDFRKFEKWLNNFLKNQSKELINLNQNIIMARLFTSDYVYSTLFSRLSIIDEIYNTLSLNFDIHQIIILYKSYVQYIKRYYLSSEEVEYTENEFNKIQSLFRNSPFNKKISTTVFYTEDDNNTKILNYLGKMIWNLKI